jgi:hypothetical protein
VSGEPKAVMLPPLVNADEGRTNTETAIANAKIAIKVIAVVNRDLERA